MADTQETDIYKVALPDWRFGVPENDSILKQKIKGSKTFGLTYVFLCERIQKNRPQVRAFELGRALKISNGYAYQILDEFVKLGYFNKRAIKEGRGCKTFFFPTVVLTMFVRESFIAEAKKWCDY